MLNEYARPVLCGFFCTVLLLAGCAHQPKYYFIGRSQVKQSARMAILPLVNFSRNQKAPDLLMNSLVVELLDSGMFSLAAPGEVENTILEKRIRLTDRIPLETIQELRTLLDVEYLFLGTVNEFEQVQTARESVPLISVSFRILSTESGDIVWAATHTRRGDDTETIFGLGRVTSLERMAEVIVHEAIATLKK